MPRCARILPETGYFHIITRGNNRQDVFHDAEDFEKYRWILWEVKQAHPYDLFHFCLMTNHVHMLLGTRPDQPLSLIMKKINLRYAQYYRKKYRYCGHFWQDRFKSLLVGKDNYLLECAAYIELNPLKAGLEKETGGYEYTSYRYYAFGDKEPLLSENPLYGEFGRTMEEKRARYSEFVRKRIERWEEYQKHLESRKAIGEEAFLAGIEEKMRVNINRRRRGRPRR